MVSFPIFTVGRGATTIFKCDVSEKRQPEVSMAISVTMNVPDVAYVWLGEVTVLTGEASPKFHK
jgi:hypothetical protein